MGEAFHPGPLRQGVRGAISVPEEVLDDLEAVLTRIDSSGSDDEPLVPPSNGRKVMPRKSVAEGSQGGDRRRRLRVVPHTLHEVGSTVVSECPEKSHPQSLLSEMFWDHDRSAFSRCLGTQASPIHSCVIFRGHCTKFEGVSIDCWG